MSTILGNLKSLFLSLRNRRSQASVEGNPATSMNEQFRFRYALFKDLLNANTELLNILADIDLKLKGEQVFGFPYLKNQMDKAMRQAFVMVKSLDVMSGSRYRALYTALEQINESIKAIMAEHQAVQAPANVVPYAQITLRDADWAGGKNANLGEIRNRLGIPVPRGFAITTRAFQTFFDYNGLDETIAGRKNVVYANELEHLNRFSAEAGQLIRSKPMPPELTQEFAACCQEIWGDEQDCLLAMRSSAVGEDGELSYAGQYLTVLGVRFSELGEAYKQVIASLYSTRSLVYRSAKGVLDEHLAMAVACLEMVDSLASGVLYTRHPYNIADENILINAVWGLGPYAVDGVIIPDSYSVSKGEPPVILEKTVTSKTVQLKLKVGGGTEERPVPAGEQDQPCLSDAQILELAAYGKALEEHYQCPQDVEWALTGQGELLILQSRPLRIENARHFGQLGAAPLPGRELLLDGCDIASQGVGAGPAVLVNALDDLEHFPEKGVLIAHHSSPEFVAVMRTCSAIVVEAGSVSGHMAALAREFDVPTLISPEPVMSRIAAGTVVTVDAYAGRVYGGLVQELLNAGAKTKTTHIIGTPVHEQLQRIAKHVVPLNLTNPLSPEFTPEHCKTLHDLARFCHELSYQEMFRISDMASKLHGWSYRLDATLPMDIHLIDLGGGLSSVVQDNWQSVKLEHIDSAPGRALFTGMLNRDVHNLEPRPVNFRGFMSVMMQQGLEAGHVGERFGDRSYAIIADKYLNFSSRVGYHYSVVDVYCGETVNKNYITFTFKGGAADSVRKNRRVRAIALILERQGFKVDVKSDRVHARLQKYPRAYIMERVDMLGRLLIFTRQLDMLMTSERSIQWAAENFIAGNYKLEAMSEQTPD